MSKTTNVMEVRYSIKTEILIPSPPQGCPACMSHKTYTVHEARQTSRSLLWPDMAGGVHHTIKHASLVMQKGQWRSRKDVSRRRLLLPQWLTQPLLPACNRPPGKAAAGVLIALAQEHVSGPLSAVHPLQEGGGSHMLRCRGAYIVHASRNGREVCFWDEKKHSSVLPLQSGSTSPKSWASTV